MGWDASTTWWVVAGVLVACELGTGTFYLLMLALGAAAAAIAGHLGAPGTVQALVAAVVGAGATAAWHFTGGRGRHRPQVAADRSINLDIGERVQVPAWNEDGTARVQYRGAAWNVRLVGGAATQPGHFVIAEVRHNELLLRPAD